MAIKSVEEFVEILKSGKYESSVNAQRAAGRTHLSTPAKKRVFEAIEQFFKTGGRVATSPQKKTGKKAKKKASKRLSLAPVLAVSDAADMPKTKKKVAKKGGKGTKSVPGTLALSPNQVDSVADVLRVIDSTVNSSVSIISALQKADALNSSVSIEAGVNAVKEALVSTARLLNDSVILPLSNVGPQTNPEVAARLEQVVGAASALPSVYSNGQSEPLPPPPPLPQIAFPASDH